MYNPIIGYGVLIFVVFLIAHVLIWRRRIPRRQIPSLIFIFILLPSLCIAAGFFFLNPGVKLSAIECLQIWLLHVALSSAYILSYPAAQAVSPSLKMLLVTGSVGRAGLNEKELALYFKDDGLFSLRIKDLLAEDFICESGGRLELTVRGRLVIGFFIFMRRLLGLKTGRG